MPYLKNVKIEGFRTYRKCTEMEAFGKGVNLVVGMNGSGKTNLLTAILFVLSDTYVNLKDDEKSAKKKKCGVECETDHGTQQRTEHKRDHGKYSREHGQERRSERGTEHDTAHTRLSVSLDRC